MPHAWSSLAPEIVELLAATPQPPLKRRRYLRPRGGTVLYSSVPVPVVRAEGVQRAVVYKKSK